MPLTPFGMDPETRGSRFTLHPAIALYGRHDLDSESGRNDALIAVLGADVFESKPGLGKGEEAPGGMGRGAEGWAAVVLWAVAVSVTGIIGGAAWEGTRTAAKTFMNLVRQGKANDDRLVVSRGGAALLAIAEIDDLDESAGGVLIEAVEEPSSIAGRESPEMNYVDIEPWIVFLIDFNRGLRYIVAVGPNGDILGRMKIPLLRFESDYHPKGHGSG